MTKLILIAIAPLFIAPAAFAKNDGFIDSSHVGSTDSKLGGYIESNKAILTIDKAKLLDDNSWVNLRGNIVQRIDDDSYMFRDTTGTLTVDIDDNIWSGQTVVVK